MNKGIAILGAAIFVVGIPIAVYPVTATVQQIDPSCSPQNYPPGSWSCSRNGGIQVYLTPPMQSVKVTGYPYLYVGLIVMLVGLVTVAVGYAIPKR